MRENCILSMGCKTWWYVPGRKIVPRTPMKAITENIKNGMKAPNFSAITRLLYFTRAILLWWTRFFSRQAQCFHGMRKSRFLQWPKVRWIHQRYKWPFQTRLLLTESVLEITQQLYFDLTCMLYTRSWKVNLLRSTTYLSNFSIFHFKCPTTRYLLEAISM